MSINCPYVTNIYHWCRTRTDQRALATTIDTMFTSEIVYWVIHLRNICN